MPSFKFHAKNSDSAWGKFSTQHFGALKPDRESYDVIEREPTDDDAERMGLKLYKIVPRCIVTKAQIKVMSHACKGMYMANAEGKLADQNTRNTDHYDIGCYGGFAAALKGWIRAIIREAPIGHDVEVAIYEGLTDSDLIDVDFEHLKYVCEENDVAIYLKG